MESEAKRVELPSAKRTRLESEKDRGYVHEVSLPPGWDVVDEEVHRPVRKGVPARTYPFTLDGFQDCACACIERKENVLVAAHTSAGKTAVAEYAIAVAFRDKQRVVYTSPIKALSNQKYRELAEIFGDVGLMTGDVSINANATCLVMTTEIMRSMIYRGSEVMREVAWVVFDEVHYMRDRERGVVWEESIISLSKAARMVFLSATLSNASEFARWISVVHGSPCHVVYTDKRPVPLQHYAFPMGGKGLFLVSDEEGKFRSNNFAKITASFDGGGAEDHQNQDAGNGGKKREGGPKSKGGMVEDLVRIVRLAKEKNLYPLIVFSFSRRECETYASEMANKHIDFNTKEEQEMVSKIFENALAQLDDTEKHLPAVEAMLPLLHRGIAMHHSGLLPILKEIIEILFQEGLVKALFATETFAMGLNMPAKTVVFTALRKWDGERHRWMSSSEYIQMSGRAGRRGKDDKGIVIMMVDEQLDELTCRDLTGGKPGPLESGFRLTYYTLINLLGRTQGTDNMEQMVRKSFYQFQHELTVEQTESKLKKIKDEVNMLEKSSDQSFRDYKALRARLESAESRMLSEMQRPSNCSKFLVPGRLLRISTDKAQWGWGVVLTVSENKGGDNASQFTLDMALRCRPGEGPTSEPRPAMQTDDDAELFIIPVKLSLVTGFSSLRLTLPKDLRKESARKSLLSALSQVFKKFPDGVPQLHPLEDMKINSREFDEAVAEAQNLEIKLKENPHFQAAAKGGRFPVLEKKAALEAESLQLQVNMGGGELERFQQQLKAMTSVLNKLGCISDTGVVLTKGRATCEIDTADELVTTELLFAGGFQSLDKHQCVALASMLIQSDDTKEVIRLKDELSKPLTLLQETAKRVAELSIACKVEGIQVEEYTEKFKPNLMDVVYAWSKGAAFSELCQMTEIYEGSIIRHIRRLDEFLNQLQSASKKLGDEELAMKFHEARESIRRGIIFSNSLYL